jgi:acyl dehydratase
VRRDAEGSVLVESEEVISARRLDALSTTLGTASAAQTATLVPFFGPTVAGESTVVDGLGMDLSRTLLGGLGYRWVRPFVVGEHVRCRVIVEQVYERGSNTFAVVTTDFTDPSGALIQRQTATFIERAAS